MNSFIAKRLKDFDSSKIRAAFEFAADIPNEIDLSIGFPEDNTPKYIRKAGIESIKKHYTRYTPSNGIVELRGAIASKLIKDNRIKASADSVTVTPGLTTAILLAYLAVLDTGDEVLVPDPFFPPYKDLALMIGAVPKIIDTFPTFQLTAEMIEPLISTKTKALVINSPNNPSGAIYPIASFPQWLKAFAKVNPEAYAVHALKSILFKGLDLRSILVDVVFLSAFTVVMMTTAIVTFKRTL